MVYIYEGHMGSLYALKEPAEDTYCEECGDYDWLLGEASNKEEVMLLFEGKMNIEGSGRWDPEYVKEFVDGIDFGE